MEAEDKRKQIAPESHQTKKAREKIRQQHLQTEALITEAALQDTVAKIHEWIAVNAAHRVSLRKKEICLFDQNQNAAVLSRKVEQIAQQIRVQFHVHIEDVIVKNE